MPIDTEIAEIFGSLGIGMVCVKIPHCIVIPHASGQAPERSEGSRSPPNEIPHSVRKPVPNLVRDDSSPHTTGNPPDLLLCFSRRSQRSLR